jgi:hypothetical protein
MPIKCLDRNLSDRALAIHQLEQRMLALSQA